MATRNIVPRADNEGSLGTASKRWADFRSVLSTVTTFVTTTLTATTATITNLIGPILGAGTVSQAPLTYTSGTNLATPAAGATEFDGVQFYNTIDATSGRGASIIEQYFHLTSNGANITTVNDFFGANSAPKFVANGYYILDIYAFFTKTTANTCVWTINFDNNVVSSWCLYEMSPIVGVTALPGTATMLIGQAIGTTGDIAVTTGSLSTGVNHYAHFKVWVQVGASTTKANIQIAATTGSVTPLVHSYWHCRRISPNNIGTFGA